MDLLCFFVLCLLCLRARLFICALWSPAGKGLTSWLSYSLNTFYFQQITSYTVQYIQFIRKLGLERKRKLIDFFSYYSVHCDMERRTVSCVISICSQYDHTLTCQATLIFMSIHTEWKMT